MQRLHVLLSFVFRKCPSLLFFSQMHVEDSAPFFSLKNKVCRHLYVVLFLFYSAQVSVYLLAVADTSLETPLQ